jgi:hypothetical protein
LVVLAEVLVVATTASGTFLAGLAGQNTITPSATAANDAATTTKGLRANRNPEDRGGGLTVEPGTTSAVVLMAIAGWMMKSLPQRSQDASTPESDDSTSYSCRQ